MGDIRRYGVAPRWSDKVVHAGTAYLVEVAATPGAPFGQQADEVLAAIDRHLAEVGSARDRLLQVTVYLTDLANLSEFNVKWERWLPPGSAPSRACVRAELAAPGYSIEMVLTAAC